MKVFEVIISILEDKGPLSIPEICSEVNRRVISYRDKPLLPSHVKSIINRKRDFFLFQEENISINPEKQPSFLVATLDGDQGICYQVNVNFSKNRFTFFEWRNTTNKEELNPFLPKKPGNLEDFKKELFNLNIWDWEPLYTRTEGITLGDHNWTVKLVTKGKIYRSEGTDYFPAEWGRFCKSIEKLTGSRFSAKSAK